MKKYLEELVPGRYVSRCVPLVIEHFGRWGTKAENFCSICHNSQQIQKPILMLLGSCRIGEKVFYNSAKMQCQSYS